MDVILLATIIIAIGGGILVLLLMVGMFGNVIYTVSNGRIFKKFYHDKLNIHIPSKFNNGEISICKICGKRMIFYDDTWVA